MTSRFYVKVYALRAWRHLRALRTYERAQTPTFFFKFEIRKSLNFVSFPIFFFAHFFCTNSFPSSWSSGSQPGCREILSGVPSVFNFIDV